MEIKTFWKIVIKLIGLYLAIECIYIIPQFASTLSLTNGELEWNILIYVWLILLVTFVAYIIITRIFLFKTDWIINTFKLDQTFSESKIELNFSPRKVLSIGVILFGAVTFAEGLPNICSDIVRFIQQKDLIKDYPETSWMIYYFLKTLLGFVIMTNSKWILNMIGKQNSIQ